MNNMASCLLELIFVDYNGFINYRLIDPFNSCLYIFKNVIFQKNLHFMNSSTPITEHRKILYTAAYQTAAMISSLILSLTSDLISSVNDLFITEEA